MGGEVGVPVQYQALGEPEPWVEVLVIKLRDLGACDHFLAGEKDGCLRAPMIDNGENAVVPSAPREPCD